MTSIHELQCMLFIWYTDIIQGLLHICTYDVDNTSQYNLQMSSATHDVQYTEEST